MVSSIVCFSLYFPHSVETFSCIAHAISREHRGLCCDVYVALPAFASGIFFYSFVWVQQQHKIHQISELFYYWYKLVGLFVYSWLRDKSSHTYANTSSKGSNRWFPKCTHQRRIDYFPFTFFFAYSPDVSLCVCSFAPTFFAFF